MTGLTEEGLKFLLEQSETGYLKHLSLYGCLIGDAGAEILANTLAKGSALEILDLERTSITNKGVEVLVAALPASNLQSLKLGENNIHSTPELFEFLSDVIPKSSLRILKILGHHHSSDWDKVKRLRNKDGDQIMLFDDINEQSERNVNAQKAKVLENIWNNLRAAARFN